MLACGSLGCGSDDSDSTAKGTGGSGAAGGSKSTGGSGGGGGSGGDAGPARPFRLGLTPFPYDIAAEAQDWVYATLETDTDLLAFHTTEGVPWVEAQQNVPFEQYGQSLRDKWTRQKAAVNASHAVYLAVTPLDDGRAKIADYWGSGEHMPPPAPFATAAFDSSEVKTAYLNFCRTAVKFFSPQYFAIGIEVNLLRKNTPSVWSAYVELHKATYTALKQENPSLPIFVTMTGVDLLEGWTEVNHADQMQAVSDLLPYSDYLGISFYPYMSAYLANPYPATAFDDLNALAGGKPIVIGESGYLAESVAIPAYNLTFEGTPAKQDAFVADLVASADKQAMPFVAYFLARDYDALWGKLPDSAKDLGAVWRDTGLYDEAGAARPAHATWMSALARPGPGP